MNFPILNYTPSQEHMCVLRNAFTAEEVDRIIEISEHLEFVKGRTGMRPDDVQSSEVRDSDVVWIEPNESTSWIHNKMSHLIGRVNYDKFNLDLHEFDAFQFTKYGIGQHYNWHSDVMPEPVNGDKFRKLSLTLSLSDPDSYKGGDILICPSGDETKSSRLRVPKGDILCFYSHLPHKVEPITYGERLSLVTWALGPKIR